MAFKLSDALRNSVMQTGSLDAALNLGFIFIYTGQQPADANSAATGTLLAVIANADGATGLTTEPASAVGAIQKTAAETWSGVGLADGVAGWFRFHALDTDKATTQTSAAGASTTKARFDGAIAASGAELNTSNTNIKTGALQTVNTYTITLPANL